MAEYIVRSYSPLGIYPSETFIYKDVCLYISDEIVLSVVKKKYKQNNPYWLSLEEVRLSSAIGLSLPPIEFGKLIFLPNYPSYLIDIPDEDFNISKVQNIAIPFLKNKLKSQIDENLNFLKPQIYPTYISDMKYHLSTLARNHTRQKQLFDTIDFDNHILMRGLDCLLKSNALSINPMYLIDACATLHIAMESSLELIFKKGNINGKYRETNKKKALRYICDEFGEDYKGGKYFEDYYKDRIIIVHPENDYGKFSQSPVEPDDFYDLYEDMIAIYMFILIDFKNFLWEKNPNY